jgi:hypothetical protein
MHLLLGGGSIGLAGYHYGNHYLKENRDAVENAFRDDKDFYFKFLFMLDRHFQMFCRKLVMATAGESKDPLCRAKRKLKHFFRDTMDKELGNLEGGGGAPPLSLPSGYKKSGDEGDKLKGRTPEGGKLKDPKEGKKKTGGGKGEQEWYSKLLEPETSWLLPEGKNINDLFPNPESKAGFPQVPHHITGKPAKACISYFTRGSCDRGSKCRMGHCKVTSFTKQANTEMTAKLKSAYGTDFKG